MLTQPADGAGASWRVMENTPVCLLNLFVYLNSGIRVYTRRRTLAGHVSQRNNVESKTDD